MNKDDRDMILDAIQANAERLDKNDVQVEKILSAIRANAQRLDKNDVQIEKILSAIRANAQRLDKNDVQVEKILSAIQANAQRLEEELGIIDQRLNTHQQQISEISLTSIQNAHRLDQMVTKEDFQKFRNEFWNAQDQFVKIFERSSQEQACTDQAIRRNEEEITVLKLKVKKHEALLEKH